MADLVLVRPRAVQKPQTEASMKRFVLAAMLALIDTRPPQTTLAFASCDFCPIFVPNDVFS